MAVTARTLSIKQAVVEVAPAAVAQVAAAPPRFVSAVKPTDGYVVAKVTSAVLIVRREPTAEDSFAAIRDRRRFGMAMAAMISNSIRENPFCFFMLGSLRDGLCMSTISIFANKLPNPCLAPGVLVSGCK